jgi:protein-S-isoprenylcysteine O-methyltransferase Ste14
MELYYVYRYKRPLTNQIMDKKIFIVLVSICILTHIVRSVYEILKHKKIMKPTKITFIIVFTDMALLWMSWFALCSRDIFKIKLPDSIRYSGIALVAIGMIIFFTALFTIKSLENHDGDLITKGIYLKIRHPMYLGFILWLIGFSIFAGALFSFFLSFLFIANILFWRNIEEKELETRFVAYKDYKKKTLF